MEFHLLIIHFDSKTFDLIHINPLFIQIVQKIGAFSAKQSLHCLRKDDIN